MSDQSAPAESGTPAPESAPAESGPPEWLGPIQERMDELSTTTSDMAERMAQLYQQPQEVEEEEFSPDDFYDEDGEITEQGAKHLIGAEVDTRLQAELSKRDATAALEQREDAFEALRDEIPALQDEKLAARLVHEAAAWCKATGNERMIERPEFVELIEDRYIRELYQERQAAEKEADDEQEVVLEAASGSAPSRKGKEVDWGQRIVDAAQSLRPEI